MEEWHESAQHAAQSAAFEERDALVDLAALIQPSGARDALVQLGVVAHHLSEIDAHDLPPEDIKKRHEDMLRLTLAAMRFLSGETGLGIEEISSTWFAERSKTLWPDIDAVAAQMPERA